MRPLKVAVQAPAAATRSARVTRAISSKISSARFSAVALAAVAAGVMARRAAPIFATTSKFRWKMPTPARTPKSRCQARSIATPAMAVGQSPAQVRKPAPPARAQAGCVPSRAFSPWNAPARAAQVAARSFQTRARHAAVPDRSERTARYRSRSRLGSRAACVSVSPGRVSRVSMAGQRAIFIFSSTSPNTTFSNATGRTFTARRLCRW